MTDTKLTIIADDPFWQPSRGEAELAVGMLASAAFRASASFFDDVTFIDTGGNWGGVTCPACGTDAEGWWGQAMDDAAKKGFSRLDVTTPCCGATTTLNDLEYDPIAGFSRFVVEIDDPGAAPSHETVRSLARLFGRPLRLVWYHI